MSLFLLVGFLLEVGLDIFQLFLVLLLHIVDSLLMSLGHLIDMLLVRCCHLIDMLLVLQFLLVHLLLIVQMDLVDLGLLFLNLSLHLHSHVPASSELSLEHLDVMLLTFSDLALTVILRMECANLLIVNANFSQTTCLVFL